jgi:DNA-binding PadR family transcriptional regulator
MSNSAYQCINRVIKLSKGEIITIFALNHLYTNQTAISGNDLYRLIKTLLPNDRHSRGYVYDTLKHLSDNEWLEPFQVQRGQKQTTKYKITSKGEEAYLELYVGKYKGPLVLIRKVIDNFLYDITGDGQFQKIEEPLNRKTLRYLNKLINVNDVIRYMVLRYLVKHGESHGYEIYQYLRDRYGWSSNIGYFYQVLREMDTKELWLNSRWINEERKVRLYIITEAGLFHHNRIGHNVVTALRNARECIKTCLVLFD